MSKKSTKITVGSAHRKKKRILLRYGELFSGPGGLSLGAFRSRIIHDGVEYGIVHSWASDYDEDSCSTYRRNISPKNPESVICGDIRDLDISSLGEIDIFAYGFPCNDFSVVGERKGFNGDFGPLYRYGVEVMNRYRPKVFVAENVSGLTSAHAGSAFREIIADLERSGNGYSVVAHRYRAEDYGVPQTRHRVIIVGIEKALGKTFKVPSPTHEHNHVSARRALEIPAIPEDAPNNELKKQSAVVVERLKHIKPGENVWTADLPEHLKLNVKAARMSQIYKRLHPDKPSYTLTGSGGGGTHGYHYEEYRALTNRERARIQTFPDDFVFDGKIESVRKQIGMAVPPLLAETIFTAILKTLSGVEYPSIEPNLVGITGNE